MKPNLLRCACLFAAVASMFLAACASQPVHSSGTPVNRNADPGAADTPTARSTGSQPRRN